MQRSLPGPWRSARILPTVKAYPSLSDIGESVCVAGVDLDAGSWIRLYPLHFRELPKPQQFSKYATIEVDVRKRSGDARPESFVPNESTIKVVADVIPTKDGWKRRADLILPLESPSMCAIIRQQRETSVSLGLFKPRELLEFKVELRAETDWTGKRRQALDQPRMMGPALPELELIPYRFKYRYICDDAKCKTHTQTIIDWELSQQFRRLRDEHGVEGALLRIEAKWANEMWSGRSTYLFTGNMQKYPTTFLVLGVFWPPAS